MANIFGVQIPRWGGALGKIAAALVALARAIANSDSDDDRIEVRHAPDGSLHIALVGEKEEGGGGDGSNSGSGSGSGSGGEGSSSGSGGGGFGVDLELTHELSAGGLRIRLTGSVFGYPVDTSTTIEVTQCTDDSGS